MAEPKTVEALIALVDDYADHFADVRAGICLADVFVLKKKKDTIRAYASELMPPSLLSSPLQLTEEQAETLRAAWEHPGPIMLVEAAPETAKLVDGEQRDPHRGGHSYEASMLRNLLAVIHRDGGHYVEQYGLDVALEDAEKLIIARAHALSELVALKDLKERIESADLCTYGVDDAEKVQAMDDDYQRRKPYAWAAAREADKPIRPIAVEDDAQ